MTKTRLVMLSLLLVSALLFSACAQPQPIMPEDAPSAGDTAADTDTGAQADAPTGEILPGGVWTRASLSDASILNPRFIPCSSRR